MPTKETAPVATTAPILPPVPGGGSWRPNAAGDGWVENLPAQAAPVATLIELPISTIQPE